MNVKAIYHRKKPIPRIYHKREIIFNGSPVIFHVIEDGKLIILGAYSAEGFPEGLYLDCVPDPDIPDDPDPEPDIPLGEWIYPVQNGNVLTLEQVYKATQNGNVLEVE